MIATVSSNIINIGLNYVLIFGKLGFPELGLNGAGIATLIARSMMPIILFFGFKTMARYKLYFNLLPNVKYSFKKIKQILDLGFPIAVQMVIELSIFSFGGIMMGWIGAAELAAHQIAGTMTGFTFMIANGVALATTIRVSIQYGAGEIEKMKKASIASVQLTLAYMSITALAYISLRNYVPMLFTTDTEVIRQAAPLFVVAGIFQLFDGLQVVCIGILRGLADVKATMVTAILSYMFVGIPISYICAFILDFGPKGIWMGFVAGLGMTGIILAIRIKLKWSRESNPTVK
jgi:MATE family multidrug resistance protein